MRLPASVQPLEIVWTLAGVVGLLVSIPFFWRFYRKYREYKRLGTGKGERILAWMYVVVGGLKVCSHLVILTIGVVAMLIKPTTPPPITPTGVIVTIGLLCLGATSVGVSYWMAYSHAQLTSYFHTHVEEVQGGPLDTATV